jgi:hypothetical protein
MVHNSTRHKLVVITTVHEQYALQCNVMDSLMHKLHYCTTVLACAVADAAYCCRASVAWRAVCQSLYDANDRCAVMMLH